MGCLVRAEDFASFRDIDPSSNDFRCIYPLIDQGRSCQRPVNKDLRSATSYIKQNVLNELSSEERSALLRQFAENCCCKNNHRKFLTGTVLARELCQRWERELKVPLPTPVSSSDGSPPKPPTTDSASTRGSQADPVNSIASSLSASSKYLLRSKCSAQKATECVLGPDEESPANEFVPPKKTNQTLVSVLLNPLSKVQDRKIGDVYTFSRTSSPGMVKIGYSKQTEDRLRQWEGMCHYKPILEHCVRNVPHASRVEKLVHYELLPHWRRELKCKHNPLCLKQHKEWFECSVNIATQSMDNFSQWMIIARPYDTDGNLKPQWQDIVRKLVRDGQEVTSRILLHAIEGLQHQDQLPLSSQTDAIASSRTPGASKASVLTKTPGWVDTTSNEIDKVALAVAGDLLSLQTHQIIALRSMLDAMIQNRLVENKCVWPASNIPVPLPLVS